MSRRTLMRDNDLCRRSRAAWPRGS